MTNIERIHKKAELIYETIVKEALKANMSCRHNETRIFLYSRDRKIGVDVAFFEEGWKKQTDGIIKMTLGRALYKVKGCIYLNLLYFRDPGISVSEKLKVIRHELGHVREIRLHNDFSEEAAKKYE